jgi:hypothetical protein
MSLSSRRAADHSGRRSDGDHAFLRRFCKIVSQIEECGGSLLRWRLPAKRHPTDRACLSWRHENAQAPFSCRRLFCMLDFS